MKQQAKKGKKITVVTFLGRDQVDYLDKLGKDYFFRYGRTLPRTKLLAALVDVLASLNLDAKKLGSNRKKLAVEMLKAIKAGAAVKKVPVSRKQQESRAKESEAPKAKESGESRAKDMKEFFNEEYNRYMREKYLISRQSPEAETNSPEAQTEETTENIGSRVVEGHENV